MMSTSRKTNRLLFSNLREYCEEGGSPNWLEFHVWDTTEFTRWVVFSDDKQRRKVRAMEHKKIQEYCDLVRYYDMTPREAEAEVWPEAVEFYKEFEREKNAIAHEEAESKLIEKVQLKKKKARLSSDLYLESKLSLKDKDRLLAAGFRRLKVSPFGEGGAAYYLVRPRYNESKLHAFFCYLIESEFKKKRKDIVMHVNDGPDIVFRYRGKECCIDVETGSNLARDRNKVERKFARYRQDYFRSYIFVTSKKLKHKYRKFGIVITRANLRKVLSHIC